MSDNTAGDNQYCRMMAAYNRWMNQRIYALCDELTEAQRQQNRGAFFGSIHRTLDHIVYGDTAWLERLRDGQSVARDINQCLFPDWQELAQRRVELDQELCDWADSITPDWLAGSLRFTSNVDGRERCLSHRVLVTHLFNHQIHHRGQVSTLLSQAGLDIGTTDLPFMPAIEQF